MKIEFTASLPPIQSALNIGGANGDGVRLKLDIPGSDLAEAAKLIMLQGKAFRVAIEAEEDSGMENPYEEEIPASESGLPCEGMD